VTQWPLLVSNVLKIGNQGPICPGKTLFEEREVCLAAENAILYSFFNLKSTNGTLNCRASLLSMPLRIGVQSELLKESELVE